MANSYRVVLSDDERADLRTLIGSGIALAWQRMRQHPPLRAGADKR